jgi:hypothetical protein
MDCHPARLDDIEESANRKSPNAPGENEGGMTNGCLPL